MHSIPDKGYSYYGEVRLGHSSLVCVSKFYANLKKCFFFAGVCRSILCHIQGYIFRDYVAFGIQSF